MSGVHNREVTAEDDDIRVDRWFRRHFPDLKHGRLEKLLRTGQIRGRYVGLAAPPAAARRKRRRSGSRAGDRRPGP